MDRAEFSTFELVAVPVFVVDPDEDRHARYSYVNAAWQASAGLSAGQVLGRRVRDVFPGRGGAELQRYQDRALTLTEPVDYDATVPMGGRPRRVRTRLQPVIGPKGRVIHLVGTTTDRGAVARARDDRLEGLNAAQEMEAFITMAAHDLRTPMRHVQFLTEVLKEDFVDHGDGKLALLDKLAEVAAKSSELISDVLAHAQASTPKGEETTFTLSSLVADILLVLDPFRKHGLSCPEVTLHTDRAALQVLLRNLFDNAIKHSGQETVALSIELSQATPEMLEVTLRDSGVGFPDPAIAFLDGGDLTVDSGFGLAGIRGLIRRRGGNVHASNRDSGGAQVRFTFPGSVVAAPQDARFRLAV